MKFIRLLGAVAAALGVLGGAIGIRADARAFGPSQAAVDLRGRTQHLHLYGQRTPERPAVIVSSGDGGWVHLAPHVAGVLSAHGYFVVGFDVRAYLEGFTRGATTLDPGQEPRDYAALAAFARQGTPWRPLLVGVSEGAGLSVLAAADPATNAAIGGVIGLGLPDRNELGWRWRDALIYLTHGVPNEPIFSTASVIARVAPVPIVAIHSTTDEFVPMDEVRRVMAAAGEPKQLWTIRASDHRFSDNLPELDRRLMDAVEWARAHQPR